jgi:hypothetical protein
MDKLENADKNIRAPDYFDMEEDEKAGAFLFTMLRGKGKGVFLKNVTRPR